MNDALKETVATAPVKRGDRWLVTLAKPGRGATGTYSADMLREYGPGSYPARTKAYFGHALPQDRDARDQLGIYPNGAFWNEAEQELQAELKPFKRWEPVLEEAEEADSPLEMSMYCLDWEKDDQDNITRMGYHRGNTVDAVAFGGLEGSSVKARMESLVESARAAYGTKPAAKGGQEKEDEMEIKELGDKLDKLAGLFESFIVAQKETKETAAQAQVDSDALAAAESAAVEAYSARIALVEAARKDLLPSQVDSLMESAKNGVDVAPLVESAKKVYAEAQTVLAESLGDGGRVLGDGSKADYAVGGW